MEVYTNLLIADTSYACTLTLSVTSMKSYWLIPSFSFNSSYSVIVFSYLLNLVKMHYRNLASPLDTFTVCLTSLKVVHGRFFSYYFLSQISPTKFYVHGRAKIHQPAHCLTLGRPQTFNLGFHCMTKIIAVVRLKNIWYIKLCTECCILLLLNCILVGS